MVYTAPQVVYPTGPMALLLTALALQVINNYLIRL